ncbi:hypothetical protein Taro_051509 [Colocasia esculenta]|uniref:Uncharacterized protein n=1 Tax=Colocasia esculenta TaxID=4460 RepID=A0A843XH77_COLES|nr:hypothetical protein [Colocasia esculenta]
MELSVGGSLGSIRAWFSVFPADHGGRSHGGLRPPAGSGPHVRPQKTSSGGPSLPPSVGTPPSPPASYGCTSMNDAIVKSAGLKW